ncbi:collagen alpha-1(I) chain-like [Dama dama]|uniref:collagen alpha-1(I) chain-like n=1 Tax=Dama dama TaxID=30532 RepID=UPI002A35C96C|nr:collagen alpha-1(I) chain-like [Dama dama]
MPSPQFWNQTHRLLEDSEPLEHLLQWHLLDSAGRDEGIGPADQPPALSGQSQESQAQRGSRRLLGPLRPLPTFLSLQTCSGPSLSACPFPPAPASAGFTVTSAVPGPAQGLAQGSEHRQFSINNQRQVPALNQRSATLTSGNPGQGGKPPGLLPQVSLSRRQPHQPQQAGPAPRCQRPHASSGWHRQPHSAGALPPGDTQPPEEEATQRKHKQPQTAPVRGRLAQSGLHLQPRPRAGRRRLQLQGDGEARPRRGPPNTHTHTRLDPSRGPGETPDPGVPSHPASAERQRAPWAGWRPRRRWGATGAGRGAGPREGARTAGAALPPGDRGDRGTERPAPPPALPLRRGGALTPRSPPERGLDPQPGNPAQPQARGHFPPGPQKSRCPTPSPSPEGRPSTPGPATSSPESSGPPALLWAAPSAGASQRPPPGAPESPPQLAPPRPEGAVPSARSPRATTHRAPASARRRREAAAGGWRLAVAGARAAAGGSDAADRPRRGAARSPGRSGEELAVARPGLPPSARRAAAAPARASRRARERRAARLRPPRSPASEHWGERERLRERRPAEGSALGRRWSGSRAASAAGRDAGARRRRGSRTAAGEKGERARERAGERGSERGSGRPESSEDARGAGSGSTRAEGAAAAQPRAHGRGRARKGAGPARQVCAVVEAERAASASLLKRELPGAHPRPRTSPPQGWGSPRAPPPLRTRPALCSLSHRAPPTPSPGSPLLPPPPRVDVCTSTRRT